MMLIRIKLHVCGFQGLLAEGVVSCIARLLSFLLFSLGFAFAFVSLSSLPLLRSYC